MNLLRAGMPSNAMLGMRAFASNNLGGNFSFPKHKEVFNDKYYEEPHDSTYSSKTSKAQPDY